MKNLFLLFLGLLALLAIMFICSLPSVYKSAAACTVDNYKSNGIAAIAVHEHNGLFSWPKDHLIRISGLLPESALKTKALSLFNNDCNGGWLNSNLNGLTVAKAAPPPPVVVPDPEPVLPSPYTLTGIVDGNRQITLNGYVPDQTAMDAVVGVAAADYGQTNVINNLQISDGAPNNWSATAIASLDAIDPLNNGRVEMRDLSVSVSGDAPDQSTSDAIQSGISGSVVAPYNTAYNITVPAPAPAVVAANTCQTDFNNLLANETINFESAQAVISSVSYALLDQLASTAALCPDASVSIEGHTDSQGPDVYNQDLSERRAQAVVDYLVGQGIDSNRLSAIGYGEDLPIGDNDTSEGRALNRRIEFTVQGL